MFNKAKCKVCVSKQTEIVELKAKVNELELAIKGLKVVIGLIIQTANQDATNSVYEMDEMDNSKLKYAREKGILYMANKILHMLGQPMVGLKKDGDKFAYEAENLIRKILGSKKKRRAKSRRSR